MPFDYTLPDTVEEALQLHIPGAQWFAGGTDLIPEFKEGRADPARLVNLKRIGELRQKEAIGRHLPMAHHPEGKEDGLYLGALATLADIAADPRVKKDYAVLAQACELSASPQIRNVGTIAGNLFQASRCPYYRGDFKCYLKGGEICYMRDGENSHAAVIGYHDCVHVHPSDPANALVALDAEIMLRGKEGPRLIRAAEFFHAPQGADRRMNVAHAEELVTAVRLEPISPNTRTLYIKEMDRAAWAFALVSAALCVNFDGDRVADARVVLGGVAPVPWREVAVENALRGARLDKELAARAAAEALREAKPLAHNAYKVRLARAVVKRGLDRLAI